jgi:hypothetical protein
VNDRSKLETLLGKSCHVIVRDTLDIGFVYLIVAALAFSDMGRLLPMLRYLS